MAFVERWSFSQADFTVFAYTVESRYLEVGGTNFYKFKLPEVQNNLHIG